MALDECRTATCTGARYRLQSDCTHGLDVIAIHLHARHAVGARPARHTRHRERALEAEALYEKESGDCGGRIISPGMSDEEPDAGGNT